MVLSRAVSWLHSFFNIFYAAMLLDAFHSNHLGINVHYITDGGIFNLCWLNAKSKNPGVAGSMRTIVLWLHTRLKMHK